MNEGDNLTGINPPPQKTPEDSQAWNPGLGEGLTLVNMHLLLYVIGNKN